MLGEAAPGAAFAGGQNAVMADRAPLLALCALPWISWVAAAQQPASAPASRPARPKLGVVVVFDQMRGDYLDRFVSYFGEGGFRKVLANGVNATQCLYPYANTETGPGHATIGSGRFPNHHGLVANDWYDRAARRTVYVSEDRSAKLLNPDGETKGLAMSPRSRFGEGLAERVEAATGGKSHTISVSIKDRAAIGMGGASDRVMWFHPESGSFVTSTFWAAGLPPWLKDFTATHSLDVLPRRWERALPEAEYAGCDPDDAKWERGPSGMGITFPHPLDARKDPLKRWEAVITSPVGMTMLTDLAMEILEREKLGTDDVVDLLWVSYSPTDYVGHTFGPESQEVMDIYIRADRELARLRAKLVEICGEGGFALAISSDHGVCECPDRCTARGGDAGRLSFAVDGKGKPVGDLVDLEEGISLKLGKKPGRGKRWIGYIGDNDMYFDPDTLQILDVKAEEAAVALRDTVRSNPKFVAAWTREEALAGKLPKEDPIAQATMAGFHPDRSGDVLFSRRPGWLASTHVASHGTPHRYDQWVPLLFEGPGVAGGRKIEERTTPADLVPTMAAMLRIEARPEWDGRSLVGTEKR